MKKTPQVTPAAFSIDEAGAYLGGIGRNVVYGLLKAGELNSFTVGQLRRVTRDSCDALIGRRAQPDYRVPAELSAKRASAAKRGRGTA